MSALRRDLLERRLWVLVVVLVIAIAAVPLLMLKSAPAAGTPIPLPVAPAVSASTTTAPTTTAPTARTQQVKDLIKRLPRDPFQSMSKLAKTPAAPGSGSAGAASAPTTTSASSTSTVAMVSPAPTSSTSASGSGSSVTTPSSGAGTSSHSTTTTSSTQTVTTSSSAANAGATTTATSARDQSWTIYSVSLRFGRTNSGAVRSNVARLTALPSAQAPVVMFAGVVSGGASAAFWLADGVGHTGPGLCRASRDACSAVVLKAGQTEKLSIKTSAGAKRTYLLHLVRISSTVTHSRTTALAAYERYSAAGLCDVTMASPYIYDVGHGTLSSVATAACSGVFGAVPFPGTASR